MNDEQPERTERAQRAIDQRAGRDNVRASVLRNRPGQPPPGATDAMGPIAELGLLVAELHRTNREQAAQIAQLLEERNEIQALREDLDRLTAEPPTVTDP